MHCGIIIEKKICGGQSEDAVRQVWCQYVGRDGVHHSVDFIIPSLSKPIRPTFW